MTGPASGSHPTHKPEVGSIWGGCGMTFIVAELWPEDARVVRITGRNGLMQKPVRAGVISLRNFAEGRVKPVDLTADNAWARAIAARYGYNPPTEQDDPRVCGRCRRSWGSVLVPPAPHHFSVFNWRTGKYHSATHGGETDCAQDATGGEWLWPL